MDEGRTRVRFGWGKIVGVVLAVVVLWWLVNLFIGGAGQ